MNRSQKPVEMFKSAIRAAWHARSKVPGLRAPIRCRLPDGNVFLAHGDAMGWGIFSRTILRGRPSYEEAEQNFVRRALRPGMVAVDVGANQGVYTLAASRLVGPQGKVIAAEPAITEYEKLEKNVRLNGLKNVATEQVAVGATEGTTEFFVCLEGRGSFSSRRPLASDLGSVRRMRVEVPLTTLDRLAGKYQLQRCDLVKVDVEGGELDVLRGAGETVRRFHPIVMCELADIRTGPWNYSAREIYRFLQDLQYVWFRCSPQGILSSAEVREKYDPDWEDLVGIPRARWAEIAENLPELR